MGFLSGSVTFERYWITKDDTPDLGPEHVKVLEKFKIGNFETNSLAQPNVGFVGGEHILDSQFAVDKNIFGDALHFGVRIDSTQIPSAMRKAWLQIELLPMIAANDGGKPTKAQREEAKEAVEMLCESEAATGKYRRMNQVPVLWDAANQVMYLGGSSSQSNELCLDLLERSFGLEFDRITSGKIAKAYASDRETVEALHQVQPAGFTGEHPTGSVTWWNGMAENYDYLGNEFLLWLWWHYETKSDTLELADDSIVTGMFTRTLTLSCPIGESGKETISSESPVVLPEATLAIRSGKLPRKAGLTMVRHDEQYEFTLQAEAFSIGSARITHIGDTPDDTPDLERENRINSLRQLSETLDLLFEAFCDLRIGSEWKSELKKMKKWLQDDKSQLLKRKPAA